MRLLLALLLAQSDYASLTYDYLNQAWHQEKCIVSLYNWITIIMLINRSVYFKVSPNFKNNICINIKF